MARMIRQLPDSRILFRSYLELDMANIVSILSFDSETVKALLSPQNIEMINHKYPIFYKICNKINNKNTVSLEYTTAVDIALENNQMQALKLIVEYIVKYQNNYVYSFLFESNFTMLLEKDIYLKDILNSNIICHDLEFDENEWP